MPVQLLGMEHTSEEGGVALQPCDQSVLIRDYPMATRTAETENSKLFEIHIIDMRVSELRVN